MNEEHATALMQNETTKPNETVEDFIKRLSVEIKASKEDSVKEEALVRLSELYSTYTGEDQLISSEDLVEKIKLQPPEIAHHSGFTRLDGILGGFRPKQLVVVSAATKSGKTSFCIDLTERFKEQQPLWLPFEESAEELIQKFLDRGEQPPHFYTPEKITGNTLLWLEKRVIEAKAKYDTKIVFIDHLHFIVPFTSERQDLAIGMAMRELKRMARTWNVTIFLIAHIKKIRMEAMPQLEDLRDSSFIAQEADTVIMLWRKAEKVKGRLVITDTVNVSVQANRRSGKTGNVGFLFENGHFKELDQAVEDLEFDTPPKATKNDDW